MRNTLTYTYLRLFVYIIKGGTKSGFLLMYVSCLKDLPTVRCDMIRQKC